MTTGNKRYAYREVTAEALARFAGGTRKLVEIVEDELSVNLRNSGVLSHKKVWQRWSIGADGKWFWAEVEPDWMYQVTGTRYRCLAVEVRV